MRTVAELAVATGIGPAQLLELDGDWIATLADVLAERK
jgi:hypothetical protein